MNVQMIWATPEIDKQIMYMARVSNPTNQDSENSRLLYYCMEHGHVSPFEMANVCLQIDTTRDIAHQIIRHRSFSFQEFSQRYANAGLLPPADLRECRMQDEEDRQNSLPCTDEALIAHWDMLQLYVKEVSEECYQNAINAGIAKEQARVVLAEGLTSTRIYMNGTMRSWIHYLQQRLHPSTQKEHREVAQAALTLLRTVAPITMDAFFPEDV